MKTDEVWVNELMLINVDSSSFPSLPVHSSGFLVWKKRKGAGSWQG